MCSSSGPQELHRIHREARCGGWHLPPLWHSFQYPEIAVGASWTPFIYMIKSHAFGSLLFLCCCGVSLLLTCKYIYYMTGMCLCMLWDGSLSGVRFPVGVGCFLVTNTVTLHVIQRVLVWFPVYCILPAESWRILWILSHLSPPQRDRVVP